VLKGCPVWVPCLGRRQSRTHLLLRFAEGLLCTRLSLCPTRLLLLGMPAAGLDPYSVACARDGGEAADVIHRAWPGQAAEPRTNSFTTTHWNYGQGVRSHADQAHREPEQRAGESKRITAFYQKTGVLAHRTEPEFRDTKGRCTLTEAPSQGYTYTLRGGLSQRLPTATAGSLMISAPVAVSAQRSLPPRTGQSETRSVRSGRSERIGRSERSGRSCGGESRRSDISSQPSWAKSAQRDAQGSAWNFGQLPMYDRTNEIYGRCYNGRSVPRQQNVSDLEATRAAGKTVSGFMEPAELISTLTQAF